MMASLRGYRHGRSWHLMLSDQVSRPGRSLLATASSSLHQKKQKRPSLDSSFQSFASSSSSSSAPESEPPPFERILIANRGEIVQRIVRTCRRLGVETVAVHSTADAQAPFVRAADSAVCLGPAPALESYLHTDALLQAMDTTKSQAVHPGYGFLSENATFCRQVSETTDCVWLGPSASAMEQMGDKLQSKQIAEAAGVSIVPGWTETALESLDQARQLCHDGTVPYPVLLKAAAGGGGKGMRVCRNDAELQEAWTVSRAEALQFFKDDRLILEKYIEHPHHIEFQVLAAPAANGGGDTDVVVFPERECSIQRRNQKIIEESPSVLLTDETRQKMAQQVVQLCQAVQYESAGTVEFLVDAEQNFYFLEMNTRLQVEHPVTEQACQTADGRPIDLVQAMLWIGAGRGFPAEIEALRQPDSPLIPASHHAVEARLYAEDPVRGFLPSTGPLLPYVEPTASETVRVDSGVAPGHVVTPFYDPMLSKVIATSSTSAGRRASAIANLHQALDQYVIGGGGIQHNARLVQDVLRLPAFQRGDTPTSFLDTHYPNGFAGVQLSNDECHELAVAAVLLQQQQQDKPVIVRLGGFFGEAYRVQIDQDKSIATVAKLNDDDGSEEKSDDDTREIPLSPPGASGGGWVEFVDPDQRYLAQVCLNGHTRHVQVLERDGQTGGASCTLQMYGALVPVWRHASEREYQLAKAHIQPPPPNDSANSNHLVSPMPGTLVSWAVQTGDTVLAGQEVCIVEAMKMQNVIKSPRAGRIDRLAVAVGDSLRADQVLVEYGAATQEEEDDVAQQ